MTSACYCIDFVCLLILQAELGEALDAKTKLEGKLDVFCEKTDKMKIEAESYLSQLRILILKVFVYVFVFICLCV